MLQIQLQIDNKTINLDPLDNVTVPSCLDLNDTLQHQESQVNVSIEYDSAIHKILVENNSIPVTVIEDGKKIFTGIIDSGLSWTDNGTPEPLNNISLVIFDNTYKLQNTAETPISYINSSLTEIITKICKLCDLTYNDEGLLDEIQIPVFILNRDQEFYQAVNDLLFEYGFAFGFTGAGELKIINLKQSYDEKIIENLFTGVKFSRTKRKYTGIELNYGKITKKDNEQVYFEGGDLGENNKIIPIIITPGSYYPFESDPRIESTEGQVYQEFSSGYAETQTLYNGEKRYTRSKDTQLLYTENHNLVKDYSDNLTVDRTEFEYTQASVRFVNNTNEDAELKQLAIKATAYYRSPVQLVRGEGKKFKYDSKYLYNKDSANALAALMQQYFLGGNFKITFKTTQKLIPGQKTQINTGLSGIIADVIILSVTKDIYSEIYDITALTEQNITLDEKKYQIQKPMTASQQVLRESSNTANQLEKEIEKQINDALSDIGVDTRIGDITSADAVLEEHQIQIKLNIDYDNFIGNIKDFIYELSMDNGVTFNEIKRVNSDIYNYPLPSIHRYKEKDYFANWKLRVKAQSQYDTYSENWYEFDIDTSNYGTWIPPQFEYDQVIAIVNEQGINVNLNNKFPSDVKLYGSYNTIVEFSRDGEKWIEVKDNYIPFDRNIDGYPEKEQVEQYKIRVHRKSYLVDHPLKYTEKYVDATGYGTWVPPVFAVNQIDAVAMEQGISVSLDNRLPNNTKYYGSYSTIIEYTRDGISWNVADGEFIYFDRDVDGYPEKSQLENYKVRVTRKSLVIDHELIYTEQYIDTSSYSTWLPLAPTLRTSISGRTININIEQPVRADGLRPYGVIKYKVQVKRITPIEDDKYSCPSLSLNPYDSEDNYKDDNSVKDYVLVDNNHRQTMPLSGQNAIDPLPVDTMYRFKITAINLVTNVEAEPLETPNLTALATSVKDIVAGAITTTKLADNCVTVDKIAVDTLVANESFMNEITSNVVNAGKLTFEVMNVKDFGFIAGNDEIFTYKYTGNDNIEHSYIPEKGELFFGSGDPDDESRNYIKLKNETNENNASSRNLYIEAETVKARNVEVKYDFLVKSGVIYNNVLNFFKFTDKGFEGVMKYFNISSHGFQIKDCKEENNYILNIQPRSLVNDKKFHDIFIDDSNIIISGENYGISTPEFFTITKGINGNQTFNLYSPTIQNPTLSGENILVSPTTKINSIDSTTLLQHHSIKSGNPHKVTANDLGIKVINNTADADKSVKHAETAKEANSALSAKTALIADFAAEAETDINGRALTSYTKSPSLVPNIVTQSGTTTFKNLNLLLKKIDGNSTTTDISDVNILRSAYSSNSGYVKFANGLIIQWGQSTSTSSNSRQIPFPINFSNTNYRITGTQILTSSGGSNADKSPRIYSKATTSAYVWTSDKAPFDWVAVGY